jgi:hypothetical protein
VPTPIAMNWIMDQRADGYRGKRRTGNPSCHL